MQEVHDYIAEAEQRGIEHVPQSGVVAKVFDDLMQSHIDAFQVMFVSSAGIAVVGAIACLVLVRRQPRELDGTGIRPALALDLREPGPLGRDHAAPTGYSLTSSGSTLPLISTVASSRGSAMITEPRPWRISIGRPTCAHESHRRRARRLVLGDPGLGDEHAGRGSGRPSRSSQDQTETRP